MDSSQVPDKIQTADIARMMAQYGDRLLRLCFLYLHDWALSEDAVQETFLRAYKNWHTFRGDSSEETWLIRIAINCCKTLSRTTWFRYVDRNKTLDQLPEAIAPFDEKDDTVIIEVMRLSAKYREVILMYYYQGMIVREISQALGSPEATINSRLKRAKDQLRKKLEGWYFDE